MRRALMTISVVSLLCAGVFVRSLVARQARPDQDVLSALLTEVHGLRVAMEQIGVAGPRVQLAMGRLQLNEQRITTYVHRLDEVRDRRTGLEQQLRKRQQELTDLAAEVQQHGPPIPEIAEELKNMKADLERGNSTLLQLQTEENQLLQQIATERDHWTEINQRLEDLDRALGGR
jgi:uncharacterized coiled-coil DUF342 family protein